jgi:hypothetical protein
MKYKVSFTLYIFHGRVLHYWHEAAPVSEYFTFIIDGNERRKASRNVKEDKAVRQV